MNPGRKGDRLRRKLEHDALESPGRIRHPDLPLDNLFRKILRHKSSGGSRLAKGREIARIAVKRNLARSGFREGSRARDFAIGVARYLAGADRRQLSQLKIHNALFVSRRWRSRGKASCRRRRKWSRR